MKLTTLITAALLAVNIGISTSAHAMEPIAEAAEQLSEVEMVDLTTSRCSALYMVMGQWLETTGNTKKDPQYQADAKVYREGAYWMRVLNLRARSIAMPETSIEMHKRHFDLRSVHAAKHYASTSAELYNSSGRTITLLMADDGAWCKEFHQLMEPVIKALKRG